MSFPGTGCLLHLIILWVIDWFLEWFGSGAIATFIILLVGYAGQLFKLFLICFANQFTLTQWNIVVPLAFIPPHLTRKWKDEMKLPYWYTILPKIFSAVLIHVKGRENELNWLKNLILFKVKMSCHLNWLFTSLISLFGICFIMSFIFCLRTGRIKKLCLFVDTLIDFMFL
jgi:hypothetical protein